MLLYVPELYCAKSECHADADAASLFDTTALTRVTQHPNRAAAEDAPVRTHESTPPVGDTFANKEWLKTLSVVSTTANFALVYTPTHVEARLCARRCGKSKLRQRTWKKSSVDDITPGYDENITVAALFYKP
jgi:hypothetical protein